MLKARPLFTALNKRCPLQTIKPQSSIATPLKVRWNSSDVISYVTQDPIPVTELDTLKEAKIGAVKSKGTSRRFYKKVGVKSFELNGLDQWVVMLDHRVVKTPKEVRLSLPSKSMALMIAFEWDAQEVNITPTSMPVMTIAATAIDIIPEKRKMIVDSIMNFLTTDVMCTRDPDQEDFLEKQKEAHDPILAWFSDYFKVPVLKINYGLDFQDHPEETTSKLQWNLFNFDDITLAALDTMITSLKSVVLAFAVWQGRITVDEALKASNLEENYRLTEDNYMERYHGINETHQKQNVAAAAAVLRMIPIAQIKH